MQADIVRCKVMKEKMKVFSSFGIRLQTTFSDLIAYNRTLYYAVL